jgi:hypothetical protein
MHLYLHEALPYIEHEFHFHLWAKANDPEASKFALLGDGYVRICFHLPNMTVLLGTTSATSND